MQLLCTVGDAVHLTLNASLAYVVLSTGNITNVMNMRMTEIVSRLARHRRSSGTANRVQHDVLPISTVLVKNAGIVAVRWGVSGRRGGTAVVARVVGGTVVRVVLQAPQHKHHTVIQSVKLDCTK